MKNLKSLAVCLLACLVLVQYRISCPAPPTEQTPLKVTMWDAFGYYVYLPAILIYHDYKQLQWLPEIDSQYKVTGGNGWQAMKAENNNYVFKYLGGVAVLQLPFFLAAHICAKRLGYPPDGFSPPYQYALGFGIILYSFLALLVLRKVLLKYFTDDTVAVTIFMLCLASNFIQYAAVDNGQSHAYIFLLYAAVLYTTMRWHEKPAFTFAALTGYIIGLATMSRPTEAVMLFIPLLWQTHTKEAAAEKWSNVKLHKLHVTAAAAGGFLGILPQLLYWKSTTGSFVFDVGSKWDFLSPHFRVLFGWEKGWFIYTPVTILFIAGMFMMRGKPFRKSVLWFCLLNIYIVIGWHDWHYGGTYSTRALVQSYPVFALPFASLIQRAIHSRWRALIYVVFMYLLLVNLFQVVQYNKTILHYDNMNRKYYEAIYLDAHPSPEDMSLLDNDFVLRNEGAYQRTVLTKIDTPISTSFLSYHNFMLVDLPVKSGGGEATVLKVEATIKAPGCLWQSFLEARLNCGGTEKKAKARLFSPISSDTASNRYVFYIEAPCKSQSGKLNLYLSSAFDFNGTISSIRITSLSN